MTDGSASASVPGDGQYVAPHEAQRAALPKRTVLAGAVGVAAAVVGLLPWLATGGQQYLQNLWATEVLPEAMPFALLPISQYYLLAPLSLLVVGAVITGMVARTLARRSAGRVVLGAWGGLALVHLVAIVQSFLSLADGLGLGDRGGDSRAAVYFGAMLAAVIVSVILAHVGFWLTSRPSVGPVALGMVLSAVPFGNWVGSWSSVLFEAASIPDLLLGTLRWIPAIVAGLALAWCGVRPLPRLAIWVVAALTLWVIPALATALQYGLGMRVLDGNIAEMAQASAQLFPLALQVGWKEPLVALVIGAVGAVIGSAISRRRWGEFGRFASEPTPWPI